MGRKPDPAVAKLRAEALRLESEDGLSVAEIAERVDRHQDTVKKWLRKARGPKKVGVFQEAILEELRDEVDPSPSRIAEIAKSVGCSIDHVRRVERENRGQLKIEALVDELVNNFEVDFHRFKNHKATRYESVGRAIARRCSLEADRNPKEAKLLIEQGIEIFSALVALRRSPQKKRSALCNLTQVRASNAARVRSLSPPKTKQRERRKELYRALDLLKDALRHSAGCCFCKADLDRRQAIVLRDLELYSEALECVHGAATIYFEHGSVGHDVTGNGIATCGLVESQIYLLEGKFSIAREKAEETLAIVPKAEKQVRPSLFFVVAVSLYKEGNAADLARASRLAEEQLSTYGPLPSVQRVMLLWFSGKVAQMLGNSEAAENKFQSALLDAIDLEHPAAVAAIEASLGRIHEDPSMLQVRILDLRRRSGAKEREIFPGWLKPIGDALEHAYREATHDFNAAISGLARAGSAFVPDIV